VRRFSALTVTVASGAAVYAAWLNGQNSSGTTLAQAHVLPVTTVTRASARPTSHAASPAARHSAAPSSHHPSSAHPSSAHPSSAHPSNTAVPTHSASKPPSQITVDGAVVDTQYGKVQVRILVTGGQLADVTALHLTDSSGRSVEISAQAAPILRQEALTARSAKIDLVSGATFTSDAYVQSLQSALDAAAAQG
jgi:uncharacterized protein with FMN-binding domain